MNQFNFRRRNALHASVNYDRRIGVLRKDDYTRIQFVLEGYLEKIQDSDETTNEEINDLKTLIWKVNHQLEKM